MFYNKSVVEIIQLSSLLAGLCFVLIGMLSLLIVLPLFSSYVFVSLFLIVGGIIIAGAGKLIEVIADVIEDIMY